MASYERIIKFENEKPQGVIRLVEANGFYRAYNQNAYFFHQVIGQHKGTKKFVKNINQEQRAPAVVNSSLGVLSHYDSYCVRKVLVAKSRLQNFGRGSDDCLRFYPDAVVWKLYSLKDAKR